ncbi:hypothetical protein GCM10027068_28530 [Prescottella soli]
MRAKLPSNGYTKTRWAPGPWGGSTRLSGTARNPLLDIMWIIGETVNCGNVDDPVVVVRRIVIAAADSPAR